VSGVSGKSGCAVSAFGFGITILFGGEARGAEANKLGQLRAARSGWRATARLLGLSLFKDGFTGAPAEIAVGVFGVPVEKREIVERGEGLRAGACGEDRLTEALDLRETAQNSGGVVGEEKVEHFAHRDFVRLGQIFGGLVVVEEAVEDGAEERVHG